MKKNRWLIFITVAAACGLMTLVELVIQPGYVVKSLCKIGLFGGSVGLYGLYTRDPALREMFRLSSLRQAVWMGLGVYGLLLLGFWLLRPLLDLQTIARDLLSTEKITAGNFLPVALYISLCNSFLEEVFFRGFAYLTLRRHGSEVMARIFSAGAFSLYHVGILHGWFSLWLFLLALAGLFVGGLLFDFLDRRGSLYPSWLVHGSANLAINTVGLFMFGFL